jgi:hypothetical protein
MNNRVGGFSLGAYPAGTSGGTGSAGDIQYTLDIPSSGVNAGIALLRSATTLNLSERLDAVGYATVDPSIGKAPASPPVAPSKSSICSTRSAAISSRESGPSTLNHRSSRCSCT